MSVNEALRVVRQRWRMVVVCLLLGLLGAALVTHFMPRQYTSDVTLYVSLQGEAENADAAYRASQLAKERVGSYVPLLTDERLTQPVIDKLQLGITPAQLANHITVTVAPDTVVLSAAVTDTSPDRAAAIANALAEEFVGLLEQLEQPIGAGAARTTPATPAAAAPPPPAPTKIGADIIRPAAPSPAPVSPDVPFNVALGAALGLVVGVAAAFLSHARDTSVRTAARLHELSSVPVLSEIPHSGDVSKHPVLVDDHPGSDRAEAFGKLRTNLQFLDHGRDHRVILVTSTVVREGKSTTACNLALALAQAGNRVLLVDANLRRPQIADYLGLDPGPGLTDVVWRHAPLRYACQRWHQGGFDVLQAGSIPPKPSELLASRRMAHLLGELRQRYDFVIVDTPALLPVSDAAALAPETDGVVLVVGYRKVSEEQLAEAVDALETVSARLLGTVLTMTSSARRRRARLRSYPEPTRPQPNAPAPPPGTGPIAVTQANGSPGAGAPAAGSEDAAATAPADRDGEKSPAADGPETAHGTAHATAGTAAANGTTNGASVRRPSPTPRG